MHPRKREGSSAAHESPISRYDVETFLYFEADLLDSWRLDEWVELFTPDGTYCVPATNHREDDPTATLGIILDDRKTLQGRVKRLLSRKAHREFPWIRTRRLSVFKQMVQK